MEEEEKCLKRWTQPAVLPWVVTFVVYCSPIVGYNFSILILIMRGARLVSWSDSRGATTESAVRWVILQSRATFRQIIVVDLWRGSLPDDDWGAVVAEKAN